MLISIALALLATANGLSLKLKKRKIRTKRDFAAKTIEKVRWERDTDMVHTDMDHMDMDHDMNMPMATMMVKKIQNLSILEIRKTFLYRPRNSGQMTIVKMELFIHWFHISKCLPSQCY